MDWPDRASWFLAGVVVGVLSILVVEFMWARSLTDRAIPADATED